MKQLEIWTHFTKPLSDMSEYLGSQFRSPWCEITQPEMRGGTILLGPLILDTFSRDKEIKQEEGAIQLEIHLIV